MSLFKEQAVAAMAAQFSEHGDPAVYTPPGGGTPVACTVVRDQIDSELGIGRQFTRADVIDVRRSELALPEKDGTFAITGGDTFKVIDDARSPEDDVDGLLWRMTVRKQ